ncbi:MAG: pentapeptide repeat-containing protein [Smithella sp.]
MKLPCCKAEEYEWCKDLETVFTDEEGKEYCVFHAPQGKKGISLDEFNTLVFNRIEDVKKFNEDTPENPQTCNFRGTIFEGDIDFIEKVLPPIAFGWAQFSGNAHFREAKFSGYADFGEAQFSGYADFRDAQFSGNADFGAAQFSGKAYFGDAQFSGNAYFGSAQFSGEADFGSAQFSEETHFRDAQFSGKAYFGKAQFSGNAYFGAAQFSGKAYFGEAQFSGYAYFWRTQFSGEAAFWSAQFSGNADFRDAQFSEETHFRDAQFSGNAYFGSAQFSEETDFMEAKFSGEADFGSAQFSGKAGFRAAQFSGKSLFDATTFKDVVEFNNIKITESPLFENVNLEKVCFVDTDVRKIDFINCTWGEREGHYAVYDETKISPSSGILEYLKSLWKIPEDKEKIIEKTETVYRRLKQRYKENHNEFEASIWHYSEKEMQRKRSCLRHLFDWLFIHLYWISSGYGERPLRSFVVLLALVGTACIVLPFFPLQGNGIAENLKFTGWINTFSSEEHVKAVILSVFQYITLQRETILSPNTLDGAFIKYAAQFFIPIQAALFFFALRNRFKK